MTKPELRNEPRTRGGQDSSPGTVVPSLNRVTSHPCSQMPSIPGGWVSRCHRPRCGRNGGVEDRGRGVVCLVFVGGGGTLGEPSCARRPHLQEAAPCWRLGPILLLPQAQLEEGLGAPENSSWGGGPAGTGVEWLLISQLISVSITLRPSSQLSGPPAVFATCGGWAKPISIPCVPPPSRSDKPKCASALCKHNTRPPGAGRQGTPFHEEGRRVPL